MTTPTIDAINLDGIPPDLRDRPSWVTWHFERQGGRTVKPPFNPRTGLKATCGDPATWGSFAEALAAYRGGGYGGIGFQLTAPFVGVDLDGCRDPGVGLHRRWGAGHHRPARQLHRGESIRTRYPYLCHRRTAAWEEQSEGSGDV